MAKALNVRWAGVDATQILVKHPPNAEVSKAVTSVPCLWVVGNRHPAARWFSYDLFRH